MESYGIEIFFANGEKDYLHRGIIHQSLRKYPDETVKEIWYCCQAQLEKTETTNSENISIHFEDMLMELERFMEKRGINIKDKKESQSRWSWLFR